MINYYTTILHKKNFFEKYYYIKSFTEKKVFDFNELRHLNQQFYFSSRWRKTRRDIIIRDNGCDLGCEGFAIRGKMIIHHIDPITMDDLINDNPKLYDSENLILCSFDTHNKIHFGGNIVIQEPTIRREGDTKLW